MSSLSNNGFDRVSVPRGEKHCSAYVLTCRKCANKEHVFLGRHGGLPTQIVVRKFRKLGWQVGHNRSNDLCPAHAEKPREHQPNPKVQLIKNFGEMKMVQHAPRDVTANEAPNVMGREDKRLIFAKLHEVYLDESKGYSEGWTDKRVAEDLGVPRAWVEQVRNEVFGPLKENDEIRMLRDEITKAIEKMRTQSTALLTAAEQEAKRLNSSAERLERRMGEIEKALR